MAKLNISGAPYFDDFDASKDYIQIPALPGRVAQAREFTQAQTISRHLLKSLGDAILKDGDIVEGCQVIVASDKKSVRVTDGRIYVDGIVSSFTSSTITITGTGTEVIGIKAVDTLIDEASDPTLRDPAQGYDNFNQPGSHRIQRSLVLAVNDTEASPIATLIDGALFVETYAPEYSTLTQTLARRTFDESGSYIVNGLEVRVEDNPNNSNEYLAVIEAGKAYVLGYELSIPHTRRVNVPRSLSYGQVTASNFSYISGTNRYLLDKNNYVKSIVSVSGQVTQTSQGSVSSNTEMYDLGTNQVVSITSVTQGGTNFVVSNVDAPNQSGVDCYLHREGTHYYLVWNGSLMVHTLTVGATFTVNFRRMKTFATPAEYVFKRVGISDYVEFVGSGSDSHPLNGTNFTVVYEQYFARKDVVYIDMYGNIDVILGAPDEVGYETKPDAPLNTLELAVISSPPNGIVTTTNLALRINAQNIGLTRFTMNDIAGILKRVQVLEYDQAVIALNTDARQTYTQHDKKGLMTDPFIDFSRIDFYYNLSNGAPVDPSKPIFDMALDMDNNLCYLPVVSTVRDLVYDSARSSGNAYSRLLTLDVTGERVILEQPRATKLYQVNPYTVFPQMPEISINPAVDNWIEDSIIQVPVSLTDRTIVSTSTNVVDQSTRIRRIFDDYTVTNTSTEMTQVGTRVETNTTESVIKEEAITFIRPRTITVSGTDFYPGLDNIRGYFDGRLVTLTPTSGTPAGTVSGSIKSKSDGSFTCTFTIPTGVNTGIRTVRLASDITIAGFQNYASAEYQAHGTKRTIQRTVTTLTTVLLHRVVNVTRMTYVDPLAQSFVLDQMTLVKGVDLYFGAKATSEPVVCEIRGMTNGIINDVVYGVCSRKPSQVNVSSNASARTRFTFPDPILLEENKEYAFVVRSASDRYLLWVAELGETDVITGQSVLQNAYLQGLMFSSSNNSSWTMHQTTDIKFRLVEDTYNMSSNIFFQVQSGLSAARLFLNADAAVPSGTSIQWTYAVGGSSNYQPITPYVATLLRSLATTVDIKAQLSRSSNSKLTPMIARDTVSLVASKWKTSGTYISKTITGLDPYRHIKVVVDMFTPGGTSFAVRCSTDDGATLQNMTIESSTDRGDGWIERVYVYNYTSDQTSFKLFVAANSSYAYVTPVMKRLRMIMS